MLTFETAVKLKEAGFPQKETAFGQNSPTPAPCPKIILYVSRTQFSIARHSGAIKISGVEYLYLPPEDALICKSLVKQYNEHRKAGGTFSDFAKTIRGDED